MNIDKAVMAFAGLMILLSVLLTLYIHGAWVWLTIFIGVNMLQASFTGFCPAAMVFKKIGFKSGNAFQ